MAFKTMYLDDFIEKMLSDSALGHSNVGRSKRYGESKERVEEVVSRVEEKPTVCFENHCLKCCS